MKKQRPIAIDLFAGAGGMTLGFEQAGFDVLASVELDPIHCATHEFNFPQWKMICRNVIDLTAPDIRRALGSRDGEVDVLFGGPPCQGFSLIGHRALDDPRNALMMHFVRLTLELKPKYFVMENVSGLTVGSHKQFLVEVMDRLEEGGYTIQRDYKVLNAGEFGVPQDRRRLFLLGCRKNFELPSYPDGDTFLPTMEGRFDTDGRGSCPTVWNAIGDLPHVEKFCVLLERDWIKAPLNIRASDYAKLLRGDLRAANDFSYPRLRDAAIVTNCLRTEHTSISIERFSQTPAGKVEAISRFLKLDPDGLCNTLRAGTATNRGAFTSPRPIHPKSPRCITVREAARLHSYPDWFRFHVTNWHGFRQIGNSVPPLLSRAVAAEIMKALGVKPQRPDTELSLGDESLLSYNMSVAAERYGVHRHVIEPRIRRERKAANA